MLYFTLEDKKAIIKEKLISELEKVKFPREDIKLIRENKNFRVALELVETANNLKEEIEIEFWEELKEKISYDGEKIINIFNNGIELLFYKDINLKENLLCFGLGGGKDQVYIFL